MIFVGDPVVYTGPKVVLSVICVPERRLGLPHGEMRVLDKLPSGGNHSAAAVS